MIWIVTRMRVGISMIRIEEKALHFSSSLIRIDAMTTPISYATISINKIPLHIRSSSTIIDARLTPISYTIITIDEMPIDIHSTAIRKDAISLHICVCLIRIDIVVPPMPTAITIIDEMAAPIDSGIIIIIIIIDARLMHVRSSSTIIDARLTPISYTIITIDEMPIDIHSTAIRKDAIPLHICVCLIRIDIVVPPMPSDITTIDAIVTHAFFTRIAIHPSMIAIDAMPHHISSSMSTLNVAALWVATLHNHAQPTKQRKLS
jgi:hypothetical protein